MNALPPVAIASVLLLGCALSTFTAARWHQRLVVAERQLSEAQLREARTLSALQARQQAIADIDARYTQELTHAQNELAQLERDVAAGRRRVRLRANCPGVSASGPTASVDAATSAGLTDATRGNYFTLRRRIETANRQINGLQDYVRQVCLRTEE
ncbi:gp54 [Sodalis phage phiSG1]|uniref:Rz-like spanin n=1 Tax=Sodalis phage phiSG1 TaxID=373126 RepID=UPI00006C5BF0|nr:Rz-like spanin [Sodalis phage phiSG1]ABN42258.1 gp54 [Sodalis phage phiSG1]BAE80470.1 putative phage endopeptidase [Sodalis phage phiSG1]